MRDDHMGRPRLRLQHPARAAPAKRVDHHVWVRGHTTRRGWVQTALQRGQLVEAASRRAGRRGGKGDNHRPRRRRGRLFPRRRPGGNSHRPDHRHRHHHRNRHRRRCSHRGHHHGRKRSMPPMHGARTQGRPSPGAGPRLPPHPPVCARKNAFRESWGAGVHRRGTATAAAATRSSPPSRQAEGGTPAAPLV